MTAVTTIDHATLEHLSQAGAVRGACVVGQPGGWGVVIQYGTTERTLAAKRGAVRIFRKFETLARYLKTVGIEEFKTDTRQFDPTTTRPTAQRTDAAERMRQTHAAAAYDKWFRAEVAAASKKPTTPAPSGCRTRRPRRVGPNNAPSWSSVPGARLDPSPALVAESHCYPDAQFVYIANDNPLAAIMQGDLIAKQVSQLIQQPGMGRLGRQRDTRELVISKTPFIVIFRVKADRIEIIRLLHSSQPWKSSPGP